jgi:hypothetical protein
MAKVLFEIELGALGQNRVYGKSQLVFGAPNGQLMLCFSGSSGKFTTLICMATLQAAFDDS